LASIIWWVVVLSISFLMGKKQKQVDNNSRLTSNKGLIYLCLIFAGLIGFYIIDRWAESTIGYDSETFSLFGFGFFPTLAGVVLFSYLTIKNIYIHIKTGQWHINTNK
jgi:hypothetical protein